jgi:hypothetical protein
MAAISFEYKFIGSRNADGVGVSVEVQTEFQTSSPKLNTDEQERTTKTLPSMTEFDPKNYDWGTHGKTEGKLALGRAILWCFLLYGPAEAAYELFTQEVISGLPNDGFQLTSAEVEKWCDAKDASLLTGDD